MIIDFSFQYLPNSPVEKSSSRGTENFNGRVGQEFVSAHKALPFGGVALVHNDHPGSAKCLDASQKPKRCVLQH